MSWLKKRAAEAANALFTCSCLQFESRGRHYDQDCRVGEAPLIAEAIEEVAREFAVRALESLSLEGANWTPGCVQEAVDAADNDE